MRSSRCRADFLIRGVTTAFFKPYGTEPSINEELNNLVIEGRNILIQSFTRMAKDPKKQGFVGK